MTQYNSLMIVFLTVFSLSALFQFFLSSINIRYLKKHGHEVPGVFRGEIDQETLSKISNYTVDSSRFESIETLFNKGMILIILLSGIFPWCSEKILSLHLGFVASGFMFYLILFLISLVLGVPFNLYSTFVIEKKYGFSTITLKLWLSDFLKSLIISILLLGILLGSLLVLIQYAPNTWWLWSWIFFACFQALLLWIFPVLIAPLFNKYEPVQDGTLKESIIQLMAQVGLKAKGVYQVDEAKRSNHTNAYFTGLGKTKRIVLFDTLLASHSADEILSILSHEIGHWKKKHIIQQLVFIESASLVFFYVFYRLSHWQLLYQTFGFEQEIIYAGILIISAVFSPFLFFLTPLATTISRRFERAADKFVYSLFGTTTHLAKALTRLAKDNLANIHPHPFYAWFYYTHPSLIARIAYLEKINSQSS